MVTGAYYPELAGGALQCQTLIRALGDRAACTVLSVSTDLTLPRNDIVDGAAVARVGITGRGVASTIAASWRLARVFLSMARRIDVMHLHGFTPKAVLLIALARVTRTPVLLKLTSHGDAPSSVRLRGSATWRAYTHVNCFVAPSPALERSLTDAELPLANIDQIHNGVDLDRFRRPTAGERREARLSLELPEGAIVILFVGMMAAVKRPELLCQAWLRLGALRDRTLLVFVGPTRSRYYEIDAAIAERIRNAAHAVGAADGLRFFEEMPAIERVYRAADILVLPSKQEGLPNVLLEAMASGLACVASLLPGTTDTVIHDGTNGLLVPSGEIEPLADALRVLIERPQLRSEFGARARETVEARYSIRDVRDKYLRLYASLIGNGAMRVRPA